MKTTRGLPELRTPEDLMQKVRHDAQRIENDPTDAYAAFDFFVTVRHLPDWLISSGRPGGLSVVEAADAAALIVCRDLADGLKHFRKKGPGTEVHQGVFSSAFDPGVFDTDNLVIYLNPKEAATFGSQSVTAIDLERRVVAYWERVFSAP